MLPEGTFLLSECPVSAYPEDDVLVMLPEVGFIVEVDDRSVHKLGGTWLKRMATLLDDTFDDISTIAPWSKWGN